MTLELLLTPPEFTLLKQRDLSETVCVVFDILRATTSMMTALSNGAEGIIPVSEIPEAMVLRESNARLLLAGEREGLRIRAAQSGGVDFDLGNSPREFTSEKVRGKTIVMTTSNGTRALQACSGARKILIGSFLNLRPVANWIIEQQPPNLILVCSGTGEQAALEDTLAAGALCEKIWVHYAGGNVADSAEIARRLYPLMQMDLIGGMNHSQNGRRLLSNAALRNDVWFSLQRETLNFMAECKNGVVQKMD
ncbi:MAG: 2-phosphosulfolactate phosphatase [Verrucomicrobiota bacterium]